MSITLFRRAKQKVGVFWLSSDAITGASFSGGITRPAELRNSTAIVTTLSDSIDENPIRAWGIEKRVEIDRIAPRSELLRSLFDRYLSEKNAMIVGSVGGSTFVALSREGAIVFEHFAMADEADFEKALRHCVRQNRGATPSYAIADSVEAFETLAAVVRAVTSDAPRRLAAGPEAAELLAGAVAPETRVRAAKYSGLATAAGFAILVATLATDYALSRKLTELETRRETVTARATAVLSRASEIEKAIDGARAARISTSGSNVPDAREMLLFLSQSMPEGVTVEELTADGTATGQAAPYEGIRTKIGGMSTGGSRFFIRGTARDLSAFSNVIRAFDRSDWRVEIVQKVDELGSIEPATARYEFLLAVRKAVTS